MINLSKFAERLDELIFEENITQHTLAENCKIKESSICRYLKGNCMPTITSLLKLADYFGCSTDFLLGLTDKYEKRKFPPAPPLPARLQKYLDKSKFTVEKFCKETGISESSFYDWKRGKREPTADNILKIAEYFDCSLDYFLGREN